MANLAGKLRKSISERGLIGTVAESSRRLRRLWFDYLDGHFDRVNGTDTCGIFDVRGLTLAGDPTDGIWYESMPV